MIAIPYYTITPCCPELGTQLSNFRIPGGTLASGSYLYNGADTSINGIIFKKDSCYTITNEGTSSGPLPNAPSAVDFSVNAGCLDEKCNPCITYYTLNDCCTGQPYILNDQILCLVYTGFCELGTCPQDLLPLIITSVSNEGTPDYITGCFNLTQVQSVPPGAFTANYLTAIASVETAPTCEECQTCSLPVYYTFNDCCTNEPFKLDGEIWVFEYQIGDCFSGVCPADMEGLVITALYDECIEPCVPIAEGCFNLTVISAPPVGSVINDWIIIADFDSVQTCADCQECCYTLTNCETDEVIYSTTNTLIQHFGNTVTLNGYDGCWQVTLTEGVCDCPVPVTVLQSFNDCPSCLPIVAYKFTSCNNQILVQYSTEDYSAYVGKTVELECGDCWFVSQIDYTPPSTQTITILYTFDNCAACAKTYYELTNCLNETQLIYTSSTITLNPIDPTNCDCIKVTWVINNQTVILETLYQASVPGYLFSLGGLQIFKIIWNDDTEVWDLFFGTIINVELIGTLDNSSNCPFGNFVINSTGIEENIIFKLPKI